MVSSNWAKFRFDIWCLSVFYGILSLFSCTCSGSSVGISTTVRNFCMWTMCTWKLTHSLVDLLEENHCLGFHIHLSFVNVSHLSIFFLLLKNSYEGWKDTNQEGWKVLGWNELRPSGQGTISPFTGFDYPFLAMAYYPIFLHTILLFSEPDGLSIM